MSQDHALSPTMPLSTGVPRLGDGYRIGRYRLIEQLGEGGMGVVYLAEQKDPVDRTVALKVMRSTLGGAVAEARFLSERQALARLSHPNIAAMYDAGATEEGFPFFVMERVQGLPLTTYCDLQRLPLRARVALFIQVCTGVQHAHQKGIIHRDLKPANVLVDDAGVPKVIDFGIAKAIDETDLRLTQQGTIGTPAYMSPEALTASDLDTRTDVYSLGVMLYEILAGVLPHPVDNLTLNLVMKLVTEHDARAPHELVAALDSSTRRQIAHFRNEDERSLVARLSGDLGWIARKATARDREERYGSAADLAADLDRFLADEPVTATPPSVGYRARKFARRHSVGVFSAAAILVVIVAGATIATMAMLRAQRARSEAEAVSAFLVQLLESANPWNRQKETTVRELLEEAARKIPEELRDYPAARAQLLQTMGASEFHLGHLESAERLLTEAVRLRRDLDGGDSARVADVLNELGLVHKHQGRLPEGERLLRESVAIRERSFGHHHQAVARGLFDLASVLALSEKHAEAEAAYRESLRLRQELLAEGEAGVDPLDVALTMNGFGNFLTRRGRLAEAEKLIRGGIEIRRRSNDRGYAYSAALLDLGTVLALQERWSEAETVTREGYETMSRFVEASDQRMLHAREQLATAEAHR